MPVRPSSAMLLSLGALLATASCGRAGSGDEGDASVVLLDRHPVVLVAGRSEPFEVEIPEDAVSVMVTIEGGRGQSFVLDQWTAAGGLELVYPDSSSAEPGLCLNCINRVAAADAAFAALAPNNPGASVSPGIHTLVAAGFEAPDLFTRRPLSGEVSVTVHAKLLPEPPVAGVLNLNFYFTGARWNASKARNDQAFASALKQMEEVFRAAGIRLGRRTWNDLGPQFQYVESMDGEDSDLVELFAQAKNQPLSGVNVFFVEEIRHALLGSDGVILGIAGGIPGPALQGTLRSGVALIASPPEGVEGSLGRTMAHEVGHFLGLFHNSEYPFMDPQIHDPIPDTPRNDPSYLMNAWGDGNKVSAMQGRVMRLNSWVRHPGSVE